MCLCVCTYIYSSDLYGSRGGDEYKSRIAFISPAAVLLFERPAKQMRVPGRRLILSPPDFFVFSSAPTMPPSTPEYTPFSGRRRCFLLSFSDCFYRRRTRHRRPHSSTSMIWLYIDPSNFFFFRYYLLFRLCAIRHIMYKHIV